jgi:KUP system potassium uptake protein
MKNKSDAAPAGGQPADHRSGASRGDHRGLALMVGAIGVVFGDIGTSPIYSLRECFSPLHGIAVSQENIVGVVSLLMWFLTLVVCVKYLGIVLRADNRGEGGILALVSLVSRRLPKGSSRRKAFVVVLGILGAALLLSDGMITPAISVLSAVEGLELISPDFNAYIVPISLVVLVALFSFQSRGTGKIGLVFGPIIALWFLVIGALGVSAVFGDPDILAALNPFAALRFVFRNGALCFGVLGSVILALTGAEVLYADLGHFGSRPIRRSWFFLVYPALILNYLGQGAYLLGHPGEVDNLFFRIVPSTALYTPLVVLATMATIIASQAVISGAFSLMRQCVQLGYWPRILVRHTSSETIGQVYVPMVNRFLLAGTVGLVLAFRSSGRLGNAYGIAVSATMLMTTCLMVVLARRAWHVSPWAIAPIALLFLVIDGSLFLSNVTKVMSGGWIVVAFALVLFMLMKTWIDGRELFGKKVEAFRIDLDAFARSIAAEPPLRVQGTAVFLTASPNGAPKALLHNLKHNKALHQNTVVLSIQTVDEPVVCAADRVSLRSLDCGIWFLVLRFGFSETPDVPRALAAVPFPGFDVDWNRVTYFVGRETIIVGKRGGMLAWRKRIFAFLFGNAVSPTDFFRLPPDNIIALGSQTEM